MLQPKMFQAIHKHLKKSGTTSEWLVMILTSSHVGCQTDLFAYRFVVRPLISIPMDCKIHHDNPFVVLFQCIANEGRASPTFIVDVDHENCPYPRSILNTVISTTVAWHSSDDYHCGSSSHWW